MKRPGNDAVTSRDTTLGRVHVLGQRNVHHSTAVRYSFSSDLHHTSPCVGVLSVFYLDGIESHRNGGSFEFDIQW